MESNRQNIPGIKIAFYIVILTEIMFFAGIISAYLIAAAKATDWPPIDQPRLPLWLSISNVIILLSSAYTMFLFSNNANKNILKKYLLLTILLAIIFIIIQGTEWTKLVNFGMQSSSGLYSSYFYTIIALHGFHVIIAIALVIGLYFVINMENNVNKNIGLISSFSIFWYFVALLWPILYILLYHF